MNEMQDKELDDLFRKSLTDPEIPFDPDAWKAMEAKLDADDRRRTGYFWLYAGVVAGIFMLVGALYVAKQNNTQALAQAGNSNTVVVAQSSPASADHTAADQPGGSTGAGINNTNRNNSNSVNSTQTVQKSDQQRGTASGQKESAAASNQKAAKIASQSSGMDNTSTKNTTARTGSTGIKKYNSAQQQHRPEYSTATTKNNSNIQTAVQKSTPNDAARSTKSAQPKATSNQQQYVAGNNNGIQNTNASTKNNAAEKGVATGVIGTTAGAEKATLSSDKSKAGTDAHGAVVNTNSTGITSNTNSSANNIESDPVNTNKNPTASALGDTTQQYAHSRVTTEAQNAMRAGEHAAYKPVDTTVIIAAEPVSAKTDSIARVDTASTKESIKKEPYKRGFSLSLILGPEYNGPTQFNFYKPNLNVGFNVEYYILPRISVLSGIVYGQKLYTCDASDYASSPSYVRYGRTYYPDYVKANCGVLDIPVNVRYKFLNKKTFNVYASTGLSSYIMLKETYIFQYANKYRQDDEYQVHNKNRYLFNIWNVSFGVEKRINDTWSVQAEPYIKIPLNGVGAGDIKLVSTGVYFSVKYYFK
ncbi:MAG TPA: outer membrane beta-barrel protein [Cytophaga sp.]|nr:outer membrane beta-barrel protein [Cytophaga sp.]